MSHVDEGTLHAYLDGELSSTERTALEAHLAQCTTCRERLREERELTQRASALLDSARPSERPAPPLEQLRASRRSIGRRVRVPLAWAASVVLALGVGYYLRQPFGHVPIPTPVVQAPADRDVVVMQDRAAAPAHQERAGREKSRADTAALASQATGAVALEQKFAPSPTPLRNVAPTQVAAAPPSDSLQMVDAVVASRAAEVSALRGRLGTTQWPVISRGVARSLLGADPVGLPGLAARKIRRSPTTDGTVVVEQQLDSSTVIQIFQRSASTASFVEPSPPAAAARQMQRDRFGEALARFVGGLRVEIAGPLTADSLNRLLEQVRPLP